MPTDIEGKMEVGPPTNWGFDKEMTVGGPARGVKVVWSVALLEIDRGWAGLGGSRRGLRDGGG